MPIPPNSLGVPMTVLEKLRILRAHNYKCGYRYLNGRKCGEHSRAVQGFVPVCHEHLLLPGG
jgi:hypothetical protein